MGWTCLKHWSRQVKTYTVLGIIYDSRIKPILVIEMSLFKYPVNYIIVTYSEESTNCTITASTGIAANVIRLMHDDVIKWKPFPRYWPYVRGIHRSSVTQKPVTRSFDVFSDLPLNKRLRKQSRGCWFESLAHPLWRHCNGMSHACVWTTSVRHWQLLCQGV